jgi:hypothetical protein
LSPQAASPGARFLDFLSIGSQADDAIFWGEAYAHRLVSS